MILKTNLLFVCTCVRPHEFLCTLCVQAPPEDGADLLVLAMQAVVSRLMQMLGTEQKA